MPTLEAGNFDRDKAALRRLVRRMQSDPRASLEAQERVFSLVQQLLQQLDDLGTPAKKGRRHT